MVVICVDKLMVLIVLLLYEIFIFIVFCGKLVEDFNLIVML